MSMRPLPASSRRKTVVLLLVIGGCLALMLLATLFLSDSTNMKQAKVVAEQFLTALEKSDSQAAFDIMSAHTHQNRTVQDLSDVMAIIAKLHGHPLSHHQLPGFDVHHGNNVKFVSLTYQEKFEQGEIPVLINVIFEQGKWRVSDFKFQ